MLSTVYTVWSSSLTEEYLEEIFTTEELALEWIKKYADSFSSRSLSILEWRVSDAVV